MNDDNNISPLNDDDGDDGEEEFEVLDAKKWTDQVYLPNRNDGWYTEARGKMQSI